MDLADLLKGKDGVLFSDLSSLVIEGKVSPELSQNKWKILPYRTRTVSGKALSAIEEMSPEPITLNLGISGWYAIFIGIESIGTKIDVRFTGDSAYRRVENTASFWHWLRYVEEGLLRVANLQDGKITLAKTPDKNATVYWIRAVPLTAEEAAVYMADVSAPQNKRLNVTEDFCEALARYDQNDGEEPWQYIVEQYRDADVESMSIEYFADDLPEMPYIPDPISRAVQKGLLSGLGRNIRKKLVDYGHRLGWKMYFSQRMSHGIFESPMQSTNAFFSKFGENSQYCCEDRDGRKMAFLSYAYPEVREERIGRLVACIGEDCDGVELIFNRCPSLILFEKPFADKFRVRYGFPPNGLPLSDERIMAVKAEIISGFFEQLRRALNKSCENLGRKYVTISIKVPYSVYDCRLLGIDPEHLAKNKLVDRIVSYPVTMREMLEGDIWEDSSKTHIDLEKYTAYADGNPVRIIERRDYSGPGEPMFVEPIPDHAGIPRGPNSLNERVSEFLQLEKYGVQVGFDVLPRTMPPEEILKRFRELHSLGVRHFSLWDTYARVVRLSEWSITSRMGHGDEIVTFSDGAGVLYRTVRLLELDGIDVSRYLPNWIG